MANKKLIPLALQSFTDFIAADLHTTVMVWIANEDSPMVSAPEFEAYLRSKKIDSEAFRKAEPEVWDAWKHEFEQVHPNSFTMQKLNLINPVRRKYHLKETPEAPASDPAPSTPPPASPPKPGRPVMRPRPKIGGT